MNALGLAGAPLTTHSAEATTFDSGQDAPTSFDAAVASGVASSQGSTSFLAPEGIAELEARLRALIASCPGEPAIVVMPPDAAWSITHEADAATSAASLIKLPILLAIDRLETAGRIDADEAVTLTAADRTPGSGRLRHAPAGRTLSLRELSERMIVESDNTATNALIRVIGRDTLQAEFFGMGLRATRLERRILERGGDNATTASEMALLLAALPAGAVREPLERVENRRRLARRLPATARLAHKTGTLRHAVHDAGILETPAGPVVIVGLVRNAESWPAAEAWLGELGRAVYEAGGGIARDRDIVR